MTFDFDFELIELTYQLPNFNCCNIEVLEGIIDIILPCMMHVIIYIYIHAGTYVM